MRFADIALVNIPGSPEGSPLRGTRRLLRDLVCAGLMQQVKVIGNIALEDGALAAVGSSAQGTYMAASYFWTNDTPGNQKFRDALKAKYGNDAKIQGYLSEPSYDTVHLYALAVNKAGTTETSAVLKALSRAEDLIG